jgi:hypothetical protein
VSFLRGKFITLSLRDTGPAFDVSDVNRLGTRFANVPNVKVSLWKQIPARCHAIVATDMVMKEITTGTTNVPSVSELADYPEVRRSFVLTVNPILTTSITVRS